MGRTNVVLNDELLEKCQELTGIRTRRGVIDHALRELLRHEAQAQILDLRGKVDWEGDLPAMRRGRVS